MTNYDVGAEVWLGGHGNIFRVSVTSFAVTKMANVHDGPVTAIALAPNGRVWSASQDQHIKGWDVRVSVTCFAIDVQY